MVRRALLLTVRLLTKREDHVQVALPFGVAHALGGKQRLLVGKDRVLVPHAVLLLLPHNPRVPLQ